MRLRGLKGWAIYPAAIWILTASEAHPRSAVVVSWASKAGQTSSGKALVTRMQLGRTNEQK